MEKNKNTQVNYSRQKTEFVYKLKTNRPSLRTKCRRPLLAAPRILPCPPKMSLRTSPQTGVAIRTPRAPHFLSRVGGGDCPPSCQPIPAHCRGRQSGHFLETGSLLPPPAALRRFPRRPADMHRTPCPASVGRGAHTPPLAAHRTTKPCHCEERSDVAIRTPFAPHLQPMRRGGVLPRPICRTLPVISCRAAPTCAAARHALHPQRRGTLTPPYRHFTNSVGDDAPIALYAPLLAKTLSLRGAERRGNPYSFCTAPPTYA